MWRPVATLALFCSPALSFCLAGRLVTSQYDKVRCNRQPPVESSSLVENSLRTIP